MNCPIEENMDVKWLPINFHQYFQQFQQFVSIPVHLLNLCAEPITIQKGTRIAQA